MQRRKLIEASECRLSGKMPKIVKGKENSPSGPISAIGHFPSSKNTFGGAYFDAGRASKRSNLKIRMLTKDRKLNEI